jgi:dipeptidyl aminopeptidase/acylaminoacyl peptidase
MRLHLLVPTFLLATVAFAQTPAKRPMTFADLQAMKRVSDPQISPSGKWVLFSVTDVSLEKNSKTNHLWVVPLAGGKEVQLTTGSGESNGRFSPDGKSVMYSSSETGSGQIWLAPWDDAAGTLAAGHPVTSLETEADGAIWAPDSKHFLFVSNVYPECESKAAGTQRYEEEANCNALKDTVAAKSPVKAMVFTTLLYRHWNAYVGPKHSHIFYGSTEPGAGTPEDLTPASVVGDHEAPTFSLGGPLGYAISPDGKEIAYEVNLDKVPAESTNNDIFVLQAGADPATAKKVSTSPGSDDGPQYSPDGKWLAWRSQARNGYESDKFDLVVMDRAKKSITKLTADFDGWVDEFAWAMNAKSIYFASSDAGEEPIFRIRLDDHRSARLSSETVKDPMTLGFNGEFGGIQIAPNDNYLIASGMSVFQPSSIYVFNLKGIVPTIFPTPQTNAIEMHKGSRILVDQELGTDARPITSLNESLLSQLDLNSFDMQSFWFPGANGTQVEGFLIKPPNFDPAKKYPVKFLIHGGPQGAWGDAWSYRWNPELFAANGYVVIMINPRGSTGYGQKFLEEVSGDWGGRPYIDLMKGLDYAEKTYPFIDKNRECALGASYGGFMADWILTHTDRFKCIVTHDGMYNPQSAFGTTEELWFNEWEFRPLQTSAKTQIPSGDDKKKSKGNDAEDAVVEQTRPAHPWDFYDKPASEDPFRKWSPMLAIKNAKTPTLVIHGQKDYRLDVSEGLQLFDALQIRGVPSKMLYFPDEGHWVQKPQNSQLWYDTVNDWCDQWTHTNKYAAPVVRQSGQSGRE